MRTYRTDYRMWAALTALVMTGLCSAEYLYDPAGGVVARDLIWAGRGFNNLTYYGPLFAPHALVMIAWATSAGWAAHALFVLYGARLPPDEAADYDDVMVEALGCQPKDLL